MKKTLLLLAIAFQILVLGFMAAKREYILHNGAIIYLRTAPIDPRDLFRGDYVRLRYEISTVPVEAVSVEIKGRQQKSEYGRTVYAALGLGERGLGEVTTVSTERPSGLFLKGRLAAPWQFGIFSQQRVAMEYGIEAYYVQQDKGREIEKQQGMRSTIQVPLEMEVAVGGDGTAVIKGHRWSPLGIGLEAVESPRLNQPQGRKSAKFRLTLKNASSGPLGVVSLPEYCFLSLESITWGQAQAVTMPERPACVNASASDSAIVVLQPEATTYWDIDFADPQWRVLYNGKSTEAGELPPHERFRLIYHPPGKQATAHLQHAGLIWHGRLPSSAFHGRGNVD